MAWPTVSRLPVTPVESPVVEKAETHSNSALDSPRSFVATRIRVARTTALSAMTAIVKRLAERRGRDGPVEGRHLALAAQLGPDDQEEDREGGHLDPAGGRGAPAAHEHEQVGHEERVRAHVGVVDRVEPRAARGHGREEAPEELPGDALAAERVVVVPLQPGEGDEAERQQGARRDQRELGVQAPARWAAGPAAQLQPDREADAADDHRERDRHQHQRVRRRSRRGCRSRARSPPG